MMDLLAILLNIGKASVDLWLRMSPYLLFGFLFAGLLHVFVPIEMIARHLGKANIGSVVKAVIFGIPLPLCSCGVVPAAMLLKKKGASNGAVLSFLIATPITGVDSIFATYSLLGWFFTLYRIVASSLAALMAGLLTNFFGDMGPAHPTNQSPNAACCHDHKTDITEKSAITEADAPHAHSHLDKRGRFAEMLHYAFVELLSEISTPLLVGSILGGAIAILLPENLIQNYFHSPLLSMLLMAGIGIPMYVCATGSIPIAAALMLKGLSPGAALVFLLCGPATNTTTIAVVFREMGKISGFIYLASIVTVSLTMGWLMNLYYSGVAMQQLHDHVHTTMLPLWIEIASGALLAILVGRHMLRRVKILK
jgi:uncharacterized membrane protein YraQ (UPF0718 family)